MLCINRLLPTGGRWLIIGRVARRVHVQTILPGQNPLDPQQAHHLRDVLRLTQGTQVELFDDSGAVAMGTLQLSADAIAVNVQPAQITSAAAQSRLSLTVAAAVPKGDRAEWMIEKLSELGVTRFIPLATQRSVVLPRGESKAQRWQRIAIESAKQSRRAGVMSIDALTPLDQAVNQAGRHAILLSTDPAATPLFDLASASRPTQPWLFIGPEGGWTNEETQSFTSAGAAAASLTQTILRVETAAIAAAAILLASSRSHDVTGPS